MLVSGLQKFPDIRYGETGSPSFTVMGVKSDNLVGIIKQQFSHEAEIIFMLPAFMMHQKTLHKQGPNVPTDKGRSINQTHLIYACGRKV